MRSAVTDHLTPLVIATLAALGGALAVYSEYDDAPGGVLIGIALIIGAVVFGGRAARRRNLR